MHFECQLKQINKCDEEIEIDYDILKERNPEIDIDNFSEFIYMGRKLTNNKGETKGWYPKHRSKYGLENFNK